MEAAKGGGRSLLWQRPACHRRKVEKRDADCELTCTPHSALCTHHKAGVWLIVGGVCVKGRRGGGGSRCVLR